MGVLTCFAKIMVNDPRPTIREEKSEGVFLAAVRLEKSLRSIEVWSH